MARSQKHEDKPARALPWSELLDEYAQAARDWGSDLGTEADWQRGDELHREITDRVNRAELAFPGSQRILEGDAL